MSLLLEKFLLAWIPLLVAMDPIGLIPVFIGMTRDLDARQRRRVARHAVLTAGGVAIIFLFIGQWIFRVLGVTVADFQIAGGLILFVLASGDITGKEWTSGPTSEADRDIGIVPLGMPLITGPAMLATLLILIDSVGVGPTLAALVFNIVLLATALHFSTKIAGWIGLRGLKAMHKIMALLLAAIAVSMIRRGWQSMT